jgi:hypothetical protein
MSNFFARVKSTPMTRNELLRSVAEVQRFSRETLAYLDYNITYKPRMDGIAEPVKTVANVVGAFVQDILVAQQLKAAGVPFWFIHPVSDVGQVQVDALTSPLLPHGTLVFEDAKPKQPVIFKGPATSLQRFNEMRVASRIAMHSSDVFSLAETPGDAENYMFRPSASSSVQRNVRVAPAPAPCKSPLTILRLVLNLLRQTKHQGFLRHSATTSLPTFLHSLSMAARLPTYGPPGSTHCHLLTVRCSPSHYHPIVDTSYLTPTRSLTQQNITFGTPSSTAISNFVQLLCRGLVSQALQYQSPFPNLVAFGAKF